MEFNDKIRERLMTIDDVGFLNDMHPFDILSLYNKLDHNSQAYLITLLTDETFANVMSYLEPEDAADFLSRMELKEQKEIIDNLDPDDAADIISELPDEVSEALVESLGQENKAVVLLKYEEDQAGSLMNNSFVVVSIEDDVKQATKKVIKQAGEVSSIQTIFVTDDKGVYIGQMPLKKLLKAKVPLTVKELVEHQDTFLDSENTDDVIDYMKDYSDHDIAVVNSQNMMVGVITASDIIEKYHDEAIEDFSKLSALPEIDFKQNIFKSAIKRLPWLLGLLVLSLFIALITSRFEAVIAATITLAFFQPLILDVGGDVASQTLAVTLIALNNEEKDIKKTGRKETISGIIIGIGLSLVAFIITYIYGLFFSPANAIELALVVSLSLVVTVLIGFLFGFFVPVILNKFKIDPAIASGPFITTSIDILSLLVYFCLAMFIL